MRQLNSVSSDQCETPWNTLSVLREHRPVVHNVTCMQAVGLSTDVLLSIGAVPSMTHSFDELDEILGSADSLTVNIGTPSSISIDTMVSGVRKALDFGTPWILDPSGASTTAGRFQLARRLAHLQPTVIRGNGNEIFALGNGLAAVSGPKGDIDSTEALDAAHDLAKATGAVIAITGKVDYVTDGKRVKAVANGDPLMTRVTALGCALTCMIGACCAVEEDPLIATAHAITMLGLSGEIAGAKAKGPGSFRTRLIDCLYRLDEGHLEDGARLQ